MSTIEKTNAGRRRSPASAAAAVFTQNERWRELVDSGALDSRFGLGTIDAGEVLSVDETRRLLAATVSTPELIQFLDEPTRIPAAGDVPLRQVRLVDLIRIVPTNASLLDYAQETERDDVAAETARGDAASESTYVYAPVEARVPEILATVPAHRRELADVGKVQAIIGGRLASAVRGRLERQVVSGDGIGEDILGILNTTGINHVSRDLTTPESRYDAILRGVTAVRLTFFDEPNAIAIHPTDYELVLHEESGGVRLVSGEERSERTLHSVPAIPSTAVDQGTVLVGAFDLGAVIRLRSGISLTVSDSHEDFFTRRMVQLLSALRAGLEVAVPRAFAKVTL